MNTKEVGLRQIATGDVFNIATKREDTTLPFPLKVSQVMGPYTERDRKLYAFLVHASHESLEREEVHEINADEVTRIFEKLSGSKDRSWLWNSALNLAKTTVEWISFEEDGTQTKHVTPLLSYASTKENNSLKYSFPKQLLPVLMAPYRFGRVRTHFLLTLSGKYAVTLYQILESFSRDNVIKISVEDLRTWLQIPEGTLSKVKDFRKIAIEPAVRQINENSDESGLNVSFECIKQGRKICWLEFYITKTSKRVDHEQSIRNPKPQFKGDTHKFRGEVYEKVKKIAPRWDVYELERQFNDWCSSKNLKPKNPVGAFLGFCKTKYKNEPL